MNFKVEIKWPAYIAVGILVCGLILSLWGHFDQEFKLVESISWTVVLTALGFILSLSLSIIYKLPTELENRLSKIRELYVIGSDTRNFEKAIDLLTGIENTHLRWLLAKFISHKLGRDFNFGTNGAFHIENMGSYEYSNLLSELIMECEKRIYMTINYTPHEWLKELQFDTCVECDTAVCKFNFKRLRLPPHLQALSQTRRSVKKVRVITKNWENLGENEKKNCEDVVLGINKKVGVKIGRLTNAALTDYQQEFESLDFNILDECVITYEKNKRRVNLILSKDVVAKFVEIFEAEHKYEVIGTK